MMFDELISAFAELAAPLERAFEALAEYRKMSSDDFFFEGYTPMEYYKRKCKREIIREIFRPSRRKYFRAFPCSRSVPGMVRKRGQSGQERGDRVMVTMESLNKLQEQYEKKLSELEMNYQDTGSSSTQRTIYKYKDLIEIMRLAELQLTGGCHACERHDRNVNYMIGKYENYQKENLKDYENYEQFIGDLKDLRW